MSHKPNCNHFPPDHDYLPSCRESVPFGWYQIILADDVHVRVTWGHCRMGPPKILVGWTTLQLFPSKTCPHTEYFTV